MSKNSSQDNFYTGWGSSFQNHHQFNVLKDHIDRAVQDIFLDSLREQNEEFLHIFSSTEKIDEFIDRMLRYWEGEENYEICGQILQLKSDLVSKWNSLKKKKTPNYSKFRSWLKSSS
jgi:hypothetical protein